MNISFIVTSFDIEPYIDKCLNSLLGCLRSGDEIIIVDDGSTDGTGQKVLDFAARQDLPAGVFVRPILLGNNTYGGVAIAGNIGFDHAQKDIIFYVDGDDWVSPADFNACRDVFAARDVDFMFVNYQTYDDINDAFDAPADNQRWAAIKDGMTLQDRRDLALKFVPAPWRKFYRRSFLVDNNIRFPEGDYFFEDNPYHWEVCLKAASFSFYDKTICYHRINRPGQTMASNGLELCAFFTHYETISTHTNNRDVRHKVAAMRWLLQNMSWHIPRLSAFARRAYAKQATKHLSSFPNDLWEEIIGPEFGHTDVGEYAEMLREGALESFLTRLNLKQINRDIGALRNEIKSLSSDVKANKKLSEEARNLQRYAIILNDG